MFSNIAGRYDVLNHLLSANVDRSWRRLVAERVSQKLTSNDGLILDVACGTGDLSQTLFETTGAQVVGTDFCRPMLSIAAGKLHKTIQLIESDALRLPFADCSFDVVTIAFGLRNLASVENGLLEMRRVLKPGGWVAVLEFSKPSSRILRAVFGVYFTRLLPLMGGVISGSKSAYTYLPASVSKFPDQAELSHLMEEAGFSQVSYENLTGGIAALHIAGKSQ
jgi:demethylmenaquinone methyltransferase/2-methoxy-6-polyprenyl-1,4-benzoquinol methylase